MKTIEIPKSINISEMPVEISCLGVVVTTGSISIKITWKDVYEDKRIGDWQEFGELVAAGTRKTKITMVSGIDLSQMQEGVNYDMESEHLFGVVVNAGGFLSLNGELRVK